MLWRVRNSRGRPRTPNLQLFQAVVRAHIWRRSLVDGTYDSVEDLARTAGLHPKVVRNKIRLAFLAPDVIGEILQGRQPLSMTLRYLSQLDDLGWREQARRLQAGA
jgi:site-specific DNA recombinase